ncbi:MAG: carbohydrate ABC transporter permease [Fusobacteriaceae bacterium]
MIEAKETLVVENEKLILNDNSVLKKIFNFKEISVMIKNINIKNIVFYILLSVMTLIIFFPIFYALGASFMESKDIVIGKIIPETISFSNYIELYEKIPMSKFFFNSLLTSIIGMVMQLLTCSLSAYAVVFIEFKSKKLVYMTILLSMFIPWEAIFIPNYLTILKMGLLNTKTAIVLPFITSGLGVFLMVQQFKGLNKALIEAAKIDGCNDIFIYTKIVLPLSKSVLGTWGVFSFLSMWNMYLWPLMSSTRPESRTIQIGLKMMRVQEGVNNYGVLMAGVVMVIVPSLIVLFLGQTQLQKGLTSGGVKE